MNIGFWKCYPCDGRTTSFGLQPSTIHFQHFHVKTSAQIQPRRRDRTSLLGIAFCQEPPRVAEPCQHAFERQAATVVFLQEFAIFCAEISLTPNPSPKRRGGNWAANAR